MNCIKLFWAALVAIAVSAVTFTACTDYQDEIDGLDTRVAGLEKLVGDMNTNLSSLSSIVNAMEAGDYITNVTTTTDGYIITFAKAGAVVIKNGKDGVDAVPATIVPVKDTDGDYYWQLNGEWMLDGEGNRVRANGKDGANAVSPQVRINQSSNEWEVSTDGGATWTSTGVKATGSNGSNAQSLIKSITQDEDYVTITLSDDSVIKIPKNATAATEIVDLKVVNTSGTDYFTYILPDQTGTFALSVLGLTASDVNAISVSDGCTVKLEGDKVVVTANSNWNADNRIVITSASGGCYIRMVAPSIYIGVNGKQPTRMYETSPAGAVMRTLSHEFNVSFAYNTEWVDPSKDTDAEYMYSILRTLPSKYYSGFAIVDVTIKDKDSNQKPTEAAAALAGTTFISWGTSCCVRTFFDDSSLLTGVASNYRIRYTISIIRNDGVKYQGAWENQKIFG